jgi:DNA polymerase III alpha subunit
MKERERLLRLCLHSLNDKGLGKEDQYMGRLKKEIKEVDAQAEHEYFLDLYDRKVKFPCNEHNNLIDFLLGLSDEFDVNKESASVQGEFPDIDIDYLKPVRDYLKREWAAEKFGQENICEIGTYGTAGIKSAMLDMTGVHGLSKTEIQGITVKMEDKDDEGKVLEWDKALEMYPEFRAYCEAHEDVSNAANLMQGRNKSGGVHAGGLIISDQPIGDFVPMEVRSVNKANPHGVICSAWTEGLAAQDLQPVGLIKFDLLVINNLMQIAIACHLIKERHGVNKICALPGSWDWSDIEYLNDPAALNMANKADLKCIFQFDSEGIRKLVKRGGVDCFDDMAAYSALYRPGPLGMGMDARYCKRKQGEEPYNIHPLMQGILGKTYGVMAYQEQVMDILRVVGSIPDMHTEKVRKAISKKNVKGFIKYKEMFIENGKENLRVNEDFVTNLWAQIESFAEYGFNKSHSYAYTYISSRLLWLKAHYPIEFYTAILMCEKDDEKFREYKLDAEKHGVDICPVHINRSRENFHIDDNEIYFGFQNIKGLGEAVAQRIVESQPYDNFTDFLNKFGTDATAIKSLTALGVFDEGYDRVTLRKFSEFFKDSDKKRRERKKRFEQAMDKKLEELKAVLLDHVPESDPDLELMSDYTDDAEKKWEERFYDTITEVEYKSKGEMKTKDVTVLSILQGLSKRRGTSLRNFHEKESEDTDNPITLDQFNPASIKLDEEEEKVLKNDMELDGNITYPMAEGAYYGFQWTHELETSPDFSGRTFDVFFAECEVAGNTAGMVEVMVKSIKHRVSKNDVEFKTIELEDANARVMKMNFWMDDYIRWHDEIAKGNMIKIRVRPPSGGFNTLTFDSVPKHKRRHLPPKEEDHRIRPMKLPERSEDKSIDLDDMQFELV